MGEGEGGRVGSEGASSPGARDGPIVPFDTIHACPVSMIELEESNRISVNQSINPVSNPRVPKSRIDRPTDRQSAANSHQNQFPGYVKWRSTTLTLTLSVLACRLTSS